MFLRRQTGQPFLMTFPVCYLIAQVQSIKINAVFSTKVILKLATKGWNCTSPGSHFSSHVYHIWPFPLKGMLKTLSVVLALPLVTWQLILTTVLKVRGLQHIIVFKILFKYDFMLCFRPVSKTGNSYSTYHLTSGESEGDWQFTLPGDTRTVSTDAKSSLLLPCLLGLILETALITWFWFLTFCEFMVVMFDQVDDNLECVWCIEYHNNIVIRLYWNKTLMKLFYVFWIYFHVNGILCDFSTTNFQVYFYYLCILSYFFFLYLLGS